MRIIIIGQAAFGERVIQTLSKKGEEIVGVYTVWLEWKVVLHWYVCFPMRM